jgi:hypothetical protein
MHSLIAAGRFVYIRGMYYSKPIHRNDPGPAALRWKDGDRFCRPSLRLRRSSPIVDVSGAHEASATARQVA